MFVFRTGVVGAGTMGVQIAQAIAAAGIPVVLRDIDPEALEIGRERARALSGAQLETLVAAGRLTSEQADADLERTLALIATTTTYEGFGDVDLAIEAVPERLELKRAVFAELDAATPGHAILATNTSSLAVGELADATTRAGAVLGLHFFNPVAAMRAVEIVEALETEPEALATAAGFVAALRKSAIRCADTPGFVVNRVLAAAAGELWRAQEQRELDVGALDRAIVAAGAAPVGPFALADALGLDTVLAVAECLREAYGERFYVHAGMAELVARGELGARSGRGFYAAGAPRAAGSEEFDAAALAERFALRVLVESCLVLEEGVASAREIDLAISAGAGLPPPFAAADAAGIAETVARLERAAEEWGAWFAPPATVRRLIAQGRLGAAGGQGFFPAPRPDGGQEGPVKLESRGEVAIAWIDNPPANSITKEVLDGLGALWHGLAADEAVRVLVIASANPALFCAGADIKAFTTMEPAVASELTARMNALLLELGHSRIVTIAALNGLAYGGGCELAMGADIRIAARSASLGQPEIKLGLIPGFGGTQRLPRLIGAGRALEMILTGEPIDAYEAWELGLVNRVVEDHELLDTALHWARRLAAAPPLAVEEIKRLANGPSLQAGVDAEEAAFARVFASADAREGIAAFVGRRTPRFGRS